MPADSHFIPNDNVIKITSNHVLLIVVAGHQTKEGVEIIRHESMKAAQKLRQSYGNVIVLIDASRIEGRNKEAEEESIKTIKLLDFDVMAVYGLPAESHIAFEADVAQRHLQNRVRAFNDRRSATSWLACHVCVLRGDPGFDDPGVCDVLPAN
ncbi:MAG TPA: hypothetical protein VFT16_00615 [Candidatus Saccharimonadales bacterium]|nr:hypothetical protein [Candidatus Saccharimonadales bacterium]